VAQQTQLADLEDSAHCPPPGNLIGAQLGNWMWRSPEAHAAGPMNKPSGVFAFAMVVSLPGYLNFENGINESVWRSAFTPRLDE
jgi:hypothetical protein